MPAARRNTQQFYVWKSNPTKCTKGWEQKKKWKDPCTTYFTHLRSLCRVHTRGGRACRRYLVRLWSVEFSSNTKEISVISQLRVRTNPKDLHSVPSNFGIWYFFFYFFYSLFFFFLWVISHAARSSDDVWRNQKPAHSTMNEMLPSPS